MKLVPGGKGGKINQYEKGESGNPKGKPKGTISFKAAAKRLLEKDGFIILEGEILDENDKLTGQRARIKAKIPTIDSLILKYMSHGNKTTQVVETFKEWFDGKETQSVDIIQRDIQEIKIIE